MTSRSRRTGWTWWKVLLLVGAVLLMPPCVYIVGGAIHDGYHPRPEEAVTLYKCTVCDKGTTNCTDYDDKGILQGTEQEVADKARRMLCSRLGETPLIEACEAQPISDFDVTCEAHQVPYWDLAREIRWH